MEAWTEELYPSMMYGTAMSHTLGSLRVLADSPLKGLHPPLSQPIGLVGERKSQACSRSIRCWFYTTAAGLANPSRAVTVQA